MAIGLKFMGPCSYVRSTWRCSHPEQNTARSRVQRHSRVAAMYAQCNIKTEAEENPCPAGLRSCQARASNTRLNGVCAARRNLEKPPSLTTERRRPSPACAPRHRPTSCEREAGVQMNVETE